MPHQSMSSLRASELVMALDQAPIDSRTGCKTLYNVSFVADTPSIVGERNEDWVRRELKWFKSGSNSIVDMEPPVPKAFQRCAGAMGEVNSSYGHILFSPDDSGKSLYDRLLATYRNETPGTRHGTAVISDRHMHTMWLENGKRDFICTNAINSYITDDWHIWISAQMRAMDAVWGYRADYSMWDALLRMMVDDLGVTFPEVRYGGIVFQVTNLHVYPRHFKLLEEDASRLQDIASGVVKP